MNAIRWTSQTLLDQQRVQFGSRSIIRLSFASTSRKLFTKSSTFSRNSSSSHGSIIGLGFAVLIGAGWRFIAILPGYGIDTRKQWWHGPTLGI
jgi:hypothetical protein